MAAGDDDVDGSMREERDSLMDWYHDMSSPMDQIQHGDAEVYHVRAVPLCDGQLVVLDSGADISLLPQEMADREINELIVIEDDFVVSSVRCPLVGLGRLLHRGWTLGPNPGALAGVNLVAPDRGCETSLQFKRNSLAVFAHIRMVNVLDDDVPAQQDPTPISCPTACIEEEDEEDSEDGMGYKPYKTGDPDRCEAPQRACRSYLQAWPDHEREWQSFHCHAKEYQVPQPKPALSLE
eukprot:s4658_g3.t1